MLQAFAPWTVLGIILAALSGGGGRAEPRPVVNVGMTAAFSGPARSLGQNMLLGLQAAFSENTESPGRCAVRLITRDDGYDPATAAANARRLIEDDGVVALVGGVGTPTAKAVSAQARLARVLFYGAISGAGIIRPEPPSRYLIHVRASYAEETAEMVKTLLPAGLTASDIAFFTQNDAFGDDGFAGAMSALSQSDPEAAKKALRVGYPRNTVAVEDAVIRLLEARRPPRAIVLVAATRPAARFIALAHQLFPGTVFLALSFVDGHALAHALDPAINRVVVTQVVPPLGDAVEAPPLLTDFRHALRRLGRFDARDNALALEGFLAGRIFLRGLERVKNCHDREAIIDGLLSLGVFDMGLGVPLYLGPSEHQASHAVWPTRLNKGKVVPMAWDELARWLQ